jgi:ATP-dependent DNA helicase RecQ
MKDQLIILKKTKSTEAVTINGCLTLLKEQNLLKELKNGSACLLYISPESLRFKDNRKVTFSRNMFAL